MNGTYSVCSENVWGDSALRGLQGTEQEDGKDAYPLTRPDEVQDRLAGSTIFSTIDLQCGYWQLLVHPSDRAKTACYPGPSMGLYKFT